MFVGECGCIELIVYGSKHGRQVIVKSGDARLVKGKGRYGRTFFI